MKYKCVATDAKEITPDINVMVTVHVGALASKPHWLQVSF